MSRKKKPISTGGIDSDAVKIPRLSKVYKSPLSKPLVEKPFLNKLESIMGYRCVCDKYMQENLADREGCWPWNESRDWSDDEWHKDIWPKLSEFTRLTWKEIKSQSSGKSEKRISKHHDHKLCNLNKEAQKRWLAIGYEQFADDMFRFRLSGNKRLWGILYGTNFYIVWYERHHRICPTTKK